MSIERLGRTAAIFGCAGLSLTADERDFFRATDPAGFILFKRNCDHPDQVRAKMARKSRPGHQPADSGACGGGGTYGGAMGLATV